MALNRISDTVDARPLGHVRLWLDDLQVIVNSLREASPSVEIIVNDDYLIDDVVDLRQLPSPVVMSFVVRTKDSVDDVSSSMTLELSRKRASLTLINPDNEALGIATNIERRAQSSQRRVYRQRQAIAASISSVILLGLALLLEPFARPAMSSASATLTESYIALAWRMAGAGGYLCIFWAAVEFIRQSLAAKSGVNSFSKSSAVVFARTKSEAPPWLQRNRDALVTNALVSAFFLIVGIIVGYALPRP